MVSSSANAVSGVLRVDGQLLFALQPFGMVRRKNLSRRVQATAYQKPLLTLSTLMSRSTFEVMTDSFLGLSRHSLRLRNLRLLSLSCHLWQLAIGETLVPDLTVEEIS